MNNLLRRALLASLLLTISLPGAARAQDDAGGAAQDGAAGGHGGRGHGGRGRGNWPGGAPPGGSAPNGAVNRHGAPGGAPGSAATAAKVPPRAAASGEQFYIISSIDPTKQELLVKRPTEVTLLMKMGAATKITDESGQTMRLLDLRAGDTVWMTSSGGAAEPTALSIRKGQMTVADLHRFYLDYGPIK